jgi:lipopolysaccharide transport system permease protein
MRVLFYASPITYPMLNVPENYQALLWINPLTSMIEPFRNSILYPESSQNIRLAIFLIVGVAVSLTAWWMYHRLRGVMSDVV